MANEVAVSVRRSANFGNMTVGSAADETVSAAVVNTYRQTVPNNSVDFPIHFPVTVSRVLVSALHSTQAVTLDTNDLHSGTPTQVIALPADGTLLYNSARDPSGAKTFTADVTIIYAQNSSGADAILEIAVGSSA